jgi:competence protein ComEA
MEQWLERYRVILFLALIALAIGGVVLIQVLQPRPEPIRLTTSTPPPTPAATLTPRPLRVYVSGAVHRPDVYILPPESIVKDALVAAGGATDEANLDRINLALPVTDGQHIYVPHVGEENPPVPSPSGASPSTGKININTADSAALEALPGIGPVIAQRIIDYRLANGRFTQIEEIMDVSGIGPATFEGIKDLIATE